jgi:hypothetical protein
MEDKFFDQHIKNELEKLQIKVNENHWADMKQQLDLEFGEILDIEEQVAFDTEVQQKLNNHQVSFNPLHWNILKNRLDFEDDRVRRVYVSKIFELTLFLLLAMFFLQNYNSEKASPQNQFATSSGFDDKTIIKETSQNNGSSSVAITNQTALSFETTEQVVDLLENSFIAPLIEKKQETGFSSAEQFASNSIQIKPVSKLSITEVLPKSSIQNQALNSFFASNHQRTIENTDLDGLAMLELSSLAFERELNSPVQVSTSLSKQNLRNAKWLNISASQDANLLNESVFAVLDPDSLVGSYGHSLSIGYSFQKNHLEFETALAYSNKEIPINQSHISGDSKAYFRSSVVNSRLHVAQIPLIAKYHFNPQARFAFYLGSGVNINLLMHSKELVEDQNLDDPKGSAIVAVPETNKLFVEDLSKDGILEGGKFIDNSYLSVNFLMGVQARLSPGISAYLQPIYQHHIFRDKLGPNKDKIHVLSLQLGTKFRF